jgi:hypothetical protein
MTRPILFSAVLLFSRAAVADVAVPGAPVRGSVLADVCDAIWIGEPPAKRWHEWTRNTPYTSVERVRPWAGAVTTELVLHVDKSAAWNTDKFVRAAGVKLLAYTAGSYHFILDAARGCRVRVTYNGSLVESVGVSPWYPSQPKVDLYNP